MTEFLSKRVEELRKMSHFISMIILDSESRTDNFPELQNDLILRAARGEGTERSPVWIMRQAGRYLPEYMDVRKKHGFIEKCKNPSLACELTLQPLIRFNLDAAIIFSDILVVPEVLGMRLKETPTGPKFENPLDSPEDIKNLEQEPDVEKKLGFVFKAITLTRHRIRGQCPLIGFSGAPWTLMSYMIEGGSSTSYMKAKRWLFAHPSECHTLLQMLTDVIVKYLIGQVKAGAQLLQVFESNAGSLAPDQFAEFSAPYLKQISEKVKAAISEEELENVPMTVFAKGGSRFLKQITSLGYNVIGVDWSVSAEAARELVGSDVVLQGNLDPAVLYSSKEGIREATTRMLEGFGTQNYIANLGHGLFKDTAIPNVRYFIDSVHEVSQRMNEERLNGED
ncbi:hypothetical protein CAPTEDRAFT_169863 [Capitella teleta]|uniref:Uroporphyrinogen decarboxylase n=1 Tax=Capitella teleta TaxID=283909 RepID=R7UAN9_CAPTE|nr:hypothetical protein CAPTEDRAFT_169863 [Capitella teleta]|eukprot:ELU00206.1 hypothetical protein CAPTEDRAFT_169863 [Capitella teleta]